MKDALIMGALGMWICGAFVYLGGQTTSALNIGLLYALSPVMIATVSVYALGESFSWRQSIGVVIALIGMVWIVSQGQPDRISLDTFAVGDLWILAATISWTVYSLRLKAVQSRFSPMCRLLIITCGGVVVLLPMTLLEASLLSVWNMSPQGLWLAVLAALFPGLLAYVSYSFMQRELGAARASMVLYLGPLYSGVMAWAFLNEPPHLYHLVGGVGILLGIYLVTVRRAS
jgi:drug/metabolite transporter (DMT)-like permease